MGVHTAKLLTMKAAIAVLLAVAVSGEAKPYTIGQVLKGVEDGVEHDIAGVITGVSHGVGVITGVDHDIARAITGVKNDVTGVITGVNHFNHDVAGVITGVKNDVTGVITGVNHFNHDVAGVITGVKHVNHDIVGAITGVRHAAVGMFPHATHGVNGLGVYTAGVIPTTYVAPQHVATHSAFGGGVIPHVYGAVGVHGLGHAVAHTPAGITHSSNVGLCFNNVGVSVAC